MLVNSSQRRISPTIAHPINERSGRVGSPPPPTPPPKRARLRRRSSSSADTLALPRPERRPRGGATPHGLLLGPAFDPESFEGGSPSLPVGPQGPLLSANSPR